VTDDGGKQTGLPVAGRGPTTVEVYTDLSCASCRANDAQTGALLNQLAQANRIRLIWHPLGAAGAADSYATRSANALACASDLGKLRPYADALFASQPPAGGSLSADQLIDLGGPIGLIQPSFAACVRDVKYADWVAVGDASAQQRGARAPAIFVNGRPLDQPTPQALLAAIS
jgi:protein-disulfide isomerase